MAEGQERPKVREVDTARLEAFSDGVFAVAITLLALDLAVPQMTGAQHWQGLTDALLRQWPKYLAYILSFLTVLIMWVNHHTIFTQIRRVNHQFLLLNGALLLVVTAFPFATSLLAEYLQEPDRKTAQVVYCGASLLMAVAYNRMWAYASTNSRLLSEDADKQLVDSITQAYRYGPLLYGAALLIAFVSAEVSLAICIVLAVFFALPSRITRATSG